MTRAAAAHTADPPDREPGDPPRAVGAHGSARPSRTGAEMRLLKTVSEGPGGTGRKTEGQQQTRVGTEKGARRRQGLGGVAGGGAGASAGRAGATEPCGPGREGRSRGGKPGRPLGEEGVAGPVRAAPRPAGAGV